MNYKKLFLIGATVFVFIASCTYAGYAYANKQNRVNTRLAYFYGYQAGEYQTINNSYDAEFIIPEGFEYAGEVANGYCYIPPILE